MSAQPQFSQYRQQRKNYGNDTEGRHNRNPVHGAKQNRCNRTHLRYGRGAPSSAFPRGAWERGYAVPTPFGSNAFCAASYTSLSGT